MGKNFVFITVECLRNDSLNLFNNSVNIETPFFDRIKNNSFLFTNYYATSSWTLPSFYSIFTSKYPNIINGRITIKNEKTFIEDLSINDYFCIGLTGGGWLTKFFGFSKGFDFFIDDINISKSKKSLMKKKLLTNKLLKNKVIYLYFLKNYLFPKNRIADIQNKKAIELLRHNKKNKNKNFFLWIHYIETHDPYYPNRFLTSLKFNEIWRLNQKFRTNMVRRKPNSLKVTKKEINKYKQLYLSEIKYIDSKLSELFSTLEKENILDENTFFIILGDHGQQFLDHGDFGHSLYLYQELINVPLIIYNKNFNKKIISKNIIGSDLASLINELIRTESEVILNDKSFDSIKKNNNRIVAFEGQNYRDDFIIDKNEVFFNINKLKYAFIYENFKIIIHSNGKDELYDLSNDPYEQNNLIYKKKLYSILRKEAERNLNLVYKNQMKENIDKNYLKSF